MCVSHRMEDTDKGRLLTCERDERMKMLVNSSIREFASTEMNFSRKYCKVKPQEGQRHLISKSEEE